MDWVPESGRPEELLWGDCMKGGGGGGTRESGCVCAGGVGWGEVGGVVGGGGVEGGVWRRQ